MLYVLEDKAHAEFIPPLLRRLADEQGIAIDEREPIPMGGAGRTVAGLRRLLADIRADREPRPDVVIVGVDADCGPQGERARQVSRACELEGYEGAVIVAEPDPHIEIWYLADPAYVQRLLAIPDRPRTPRVRCRRQEYKDRLRETVRASGAPTPFGGVEYGPEIAEGMDLYQAGREVPSLRRFIDEVRDCLRAQP